LNFNTKTKEAKLLTDQDVCKSCGTPVSPEAQYCETCGAPLGGQGFEPEKKEERSQSHPPPQHSAPQHATIPQASYEGVSIRFVAILIDWIIIGVITSIIDLPLILGGIMNNVVVTVNNATGQVAVSGGPSAALWGWVGLVGLAVPFLYYTLLQGKYGQSVGMMAVKIKVMNEDGSPIDYGAAAVRTVLMIIDAIPYFIPYLLGAILIWSSDKKQRLGDRVAHTVVIKA
jgi:uncharacterized RDD family membrane protein YckC